MYLIRGLLTSRRQDGSPQSVCSAAQGARGAWKGLSLTVGVDVVCVRMTTGKGGRGGRMEGMEQC